MRTDGMLEGVYICECGATLLRVHARVCDYKVVDIDGARDWHLTDEDMERLGAGLLSIQARVGAQLRRDRRREAIVRELGK
jgi:hypothetical protein